MQIRTAMPLSTNDPASKWMPVQDHRPITVGLTAEVDLLAGMHCTVYMCRVQTSSEEDSLNTKRSVQPSH